MYGRFDPMLRIGIAQIHNHFDYGANLRGIESALRVHADGKADLVLFPECATTGFNTGMKNLSEEGIRATVCAVQDLARAHGLSVALPTPWPAGGGKFFNSVLLINERGEIAQVFSKIGFQRGEERLFLSGAPHPRCFELKGYKVGVLICIEASHDPWSYLKQDDAPDVILWPGFYSCAPGTTWSDDPTKEARQIRSNIAHWKAPLLQATCASSPESEKWPDRTFGCSPAISADGMEAYAAHPGLEDMILIELEGRRIASARSLVFPTYWKSCTN
jgi:predicted amidohydrolase